MRNILAIAGKELRVYFTTWTSYILFGAFMLLCAFSFYRILADYMYVSAQYQYAQDPRLLEQLNLTDTVMGSVFRNADLFLLFLLPIVTMRLFAEERKSKTLELLMTVPVRPVEIVLGKYLSTLVVLGAMLALTLVFPALLHVYGQSGGEGGGAPIDWATVGSGYLGLFLLGAVFLAVGLFASSVTESQIIAVVVGWFILLMAHLVGFATYGEEGVEYRVLKHLSVTDHLDRLVTGVIALPSLVYFASLVLLALLLCYRVVEAERWR